MFYMNMYWIMLIREEIEYESKVFENLSHYTIISFTIRLTTY